MKVLVPLDGSRLSEAVLPRLSALLPLGVDEVTLTAVAETFTTSAEVPGSDEFFERECVLYTAYLSDTSVKVQEQMGAAVRVNTALRCGIPHEEILKLSSSTGADLIALTTHGRSGMSRLAIGSVADKLIRSADRPVLVIGREAAKMEADRPIKDILVPLDGSGAAETALSFATHWSDALSARLHLVEVVNVMPVIAADESLVTYTPQLLQSLQEAATNYLKQVADRHSLQSAKKTVVRGYISSELTSYCEKNQIDLVVMTTHGRGGLTRAVLGSTTDRMLHGPSPVLVIPA